MAAADCRLGGYALRAQRDGIATRAGHLSPKTRSTRLCGSSRRGLPRRSGVAADRLILNPGMGFFLSPAPETSLHVLSNLQKLKSALGLPLLVSVSRKSFLGATVGLPVKDLGASEPCGRIHAIGNGADYIPAPTRWRSAKRNHLLGNPSRNFAVATPETEG
ncbi:dihydropteroate synthase [Providencia hangzhouensis]|uniref:dihydropteroate synthase n=1 Tax=Providencia hangzhouensis TaxID=3031799 RepID=UPI00397CCF6E